MNGRLRLELLPYTARPRPARPEATPRLPMRHGFLLRIADEGGEVGQGEASPLEDSGGDTLGKAREAVETARPAVESLKARVEAREPLAELVGTLGARSASAAFAMETAVLDLIGRRTRRTVAALLDPTASPRDVPVNALILADDPETAMREAEDAVSRGIRVLKCKIGRGSGFDAECGTLAAVHSALPAGARLRLDVNGAWSAAEAGRRLHALAAFDPEYVEQPVCPEDLVGLRNSPVPLAADESLRIGEGVRRLIGAGNCRVFVLKPMALGGLSRCLAIAREAARAGIASVVTHAFDGMVARAAAAHLAAVLPGERFACGLDDHPYLHAWPTVEWPCVRNGRIPPPVRPGLGIPVLEPPR